MSYDMIWFKPLSLQDREFTKNLRIVNDKHFLGSNYITHNGHEAFIRDWMHSGGFYIIMLDYTRIGTISVNITSGEIGHVIMHNEFRRKGYTLRAMAIAVSMIKSSSNHPTPFVRVLEGNEPALAMYKKLGFTTKYHVMELAE